MICGKTGGLPYQNVTLPNSNGTCPTGYSYCGSGVVASTTVCYEDTNDCPITSIQFIDSSLAAQYEFMGYTVIDYNNT